MFVRPSKLSLLLLVGCVEAGPPLSRLTQGWAVETAEIASDALTGSVVLSGLAAELCWSRGAAQWDDIGIGDGLPISEELDAALGNPIVASFEIQGSGAVSITLSGVRLAGREGQWLRIVATAETDQYQLEFSPLVADEEEGDETARLEGYGQINLAVDDSCSPGRSMVSGNALFIAEDGRRQEVKVPADSEFGSDLIMDADTPWVPIGGVLGWSARIDAQSRSITTEDAVDLRIDSDGMWRWPVDVHGPDWSGTALTSIQP